MTEVSVGVNIDGKEMEIPLLVRTSTPEEKAILAEGRPPTRAMIDKAVAHARERLAQGKSPFAEDGEQIKQ